MPIRQLRPRQSRDHQALVQRLADEWRQPNPAATEPVILEEFSNSGDLLHVYVVWNAWSPVDRSERGEIIMEAAEIRYGLTELASVTLALGLTEAEADQASISWQ